MRKHFGKIILGILVLMLAIGLPYIDYVHAQTAHYVTVTWTASTTAGVLYIVSRSTSSTGTFTALNLTGTSALTYQDSTGTAGTTYYYEITVTCTGGTCPAGISGNSAPSSPSSGVLFLGSPAAVASPGVSAS
jgi:hypothetical protein